MAYSPPGAPQVFRPQIPLPNELQIQNSISHICFDSQSSSSIWCLYRGESKRIIHMDLNDTDTSTKRGKQSVWFSTKMTSPICLGFAGLGVGSIESKEFANVLSYDKDFMSSMCYNIDGGQLIGQSHFKRTADTTIRPHDVKNGYVRLIANSMTEFQQIHICDECHVPFDENEIQKLEHNGTFNLWTVNPFTKECVSIISIKNLVNRLDGAFHVQDWNKYYVYGIWSNEDRECVVEWDVKKQRLRVLHEVSPSETRKIMAIQIINCNKEEQTIVVAEGAIELLNANTDIQGRYYFKRWKVIVIDKTGNKVFLPRMVSDRSLFHHVEIYARSKGVGVADIIVTAKLFQADQTITDMQLGLKSMWFWENFEVTAHVVAPKRRRKRSD